MYSACNNCYLSHKACKKYIHSVFCENCLKKNIICKENKKCRYNILRYTKDIRLAANILCLLQYKKN